MTADHAPHLGLSLAEEIRRALARLPFKLVDDVLKILAAHQSSLLRHGPCLVRAATLCRRGGSFAARRYRLREGGFDEAIDVAVKHSRRIAHFDAGAEVLHERIRVENVGADLTSPVR